MVSVSPDLPVTTQRPGSSASLQGGDIQFSGLYEPPSECTRTDESALTMSSRERRREMGRQPPRVVHAAPGDDETHGTQL